ncbi:MAG: tRNA dimethylallyltransferase [Acidithiobacillales bacterium SG8_45]|jgi:tRNA dimethylallyltransferase|nr:MAG: tRNA dimethylallyltransferase [Acidithiobacillales bacterium SG8_45]
MSQSSIFLMGPTAVGKTDLAMALHEALPVELISVDSSQVYRGMDIGTAKPGREELRLVPHRLIDIRDPATPYSAADFVEDANREMELIWQDQRIPLLVGGTIFYFHSLEHGLSELPSADPEVREQLLQEAEKIGWPAMHARLAQSDPESAARIHPNDAQRVQRALEVLEVSGQGVTEISRKTPPKAMPETPVKLVLLPADREALHQRIARRFHKMLEDGLVDEVEALYRRGDLNPQLPAMRMVGYRQVWELLEGKYDYNQMVEKGIAATRQLAKRQLTWLRSYEGVQVFTDSDPRLKEKSLEFLKGKLSDLGVY